MNNTDLETQLENIFPEVIGAVITQVRNKTNLCPVNFQAVSTKYENPTTICIGLSNDSYTLANILATSQFTYAYPSAEQLKDIIYCGTVSGKSEDKLAKTSLAFSPSKTVAPPNLQDAIINFECKVVHSHKAGDFTVVIGEVAHIGSINKEASKIYSLGQTKYGVLGLPSILQDGRG